MRTFFKRLSRMCDGSYTILRWGVLLSLTCAACALCVILCAGEFSARTYSLWQYARVLKDTPPGARQCGGIGTWSIPAAQVAASFHVDARRIVFDPYTSRVWMETVE